MEKFTSRRVISSPSGYVGYEEEEKNIELELEESARDFLIKEGYDPAFGARPMRRAVERHLEDPLAESLLRGEFKEASLVAVYHKKGEKKLSFEAKPSNQEPDEAEVTG